MVITPMIFKNDESQVPGLNIRIDGVYVREEDKNNIAKAISMVIEKYSILHPPDTTYPTIIEDKIDYDNQVDHDKKLEDIISQAAGKKCTITNGFINLEKAAEDVINARIEFYNECLVEIRMGNGLGEQWFMNCVETLRGELARRKELV